jgi:putative transposase
MPRARRYTLTDLPQHVVQRGNNKQRTFFTEDDHGFYLASLYVAARRYGVEVYAYALMPNHVHLLMRPCERGAISRVMQSVGRRFVKFVNEKHGRTGTLWEGRHKTNVVQDERYLANCHAYIELNPVRAGIVPRAELFAWTSASHYLGLRQDPLLTECPVFRATAPDLRGRIAAHRERLSRGIDGDTLEHIRAAQRHGVALGGERFEEELNRALLRRPPGARPRGRPRKVAVA